MTRPESRESLESGWNVWSVAILPIWIFWPVMDEFLAAAINVSAQSSSPVYTKVSVVYAKSCSSLINLFFQYRFIVVHLYLLRSELSPLSDG